MKAVYYIFVILFIVGVLYRGAFVSQDNAIEALETQGFTNIEITDHSYFLIGLRGGEESDAARFTAMADNPIGKRVEVYVYVGWPFKGATIRH